MKRLLTAATLVSGIFAVLATVACSAHEPVRVLNDLDFEVALVRCESKSIASGETYISPGEIRSIKAGATCPVQGPTSKGGPLGTAKLNGPYIGCLLIPDDAERDGVTLRVSQADRTVSFRTCDGVE
jgi:hypothetical protein